TFVFQVAKGALGAVCYFARAYDNLNIKNAENDQSRVYPNPADGQLFIEFPQTGSYELKLYSSSGQLITKQNFSGNKAVLKTNTLKDDVYLLRTVGSEVDFIQKIIIKH